MSEQSRSIRGLMLLEEIARADNPVTANELAQRLGMPKATVYRLCEQLREGDFIRPSLFGRGYVAGPALWKLSQAVTASRSLYAHRHAILVSVARVTGETCNLGVNDGIEMVYWDRVESEWPLRLQFPIGVRVPLHCTAGGKLFLASLPVAKRRALIAELEFKSYTSTTITNAGALESACEKIASNGYSTDDEEFIDGIMAIAVPVRDASGRFVASLTTQAPVGRLSLEAAIAHLPLMRAAALRIMTIGPSADGSSCDPIDDDMATGDDDAGQPGRTAARSRLD